MRVLEMFNLSGRRALVTGSSRGIGAAIALGLAEAGADVAVHSATNAQAANHVAGQVRDLGRQAYVVQCDLAEDDAAARIHEAVGANLGSVDILIHNASVQHRCAWTDITQAQFKQQVNVNLRSVLELSQCFTPAMVERGWGRVVTVGSVQQIRPHAQMAVYSATKSAVDNLTRNLARQLAGAGVTVNNLSPGVIDTDRNREALNDPAVRDGLCERIPAQRVGQPKDCVGAALLLCSAAGDYITGQTLYVDGGMGI